MAIEPVTSAGPPGGFASVVPIPSRQVESTATTTTAALRVDSPKGVSGRVDLTSATSAPSQSPAQAPDKVDVENAVAKVQKVVAAQASNLQFSIDEDSGRTVVKIVDSSTQELIRQIPSEEILSIAKALDKLQGLLLRQTA